MAAIHIAITMRSLGTLRLPAVQVDGYCTPTAQLRERDSPNDWFTNTSYSTAHYVAMIWRQAPSAPYISGELREADSPNDWFTNTSYSTSTLRSNDLETG